MRGSIITAAGGWFVVVGLFLGATVAQATAVNLSYLEGKDPIATDAITSHGNDLFGDRVNLYNGALEFEQTDLSLPGNSSLPLALVRRHTAGQPWEVRGQFGDWDLEAPRIGGTFSLLYGWVTGIDRTTNRCSGYSTPPVVSSSTGFFAESVGSTSPATPSASVPAAGSAIVSTAGKPGTDPASTNSTLVGFIGPDYWRGTHLYIPGQGAQEVLKRAPAYTGKPTDGGAYPLVTHRNWQIDCLPSLRNAPGEGFVAVSPEGVRYRFDWMATRPQTDVKKSGASIGRVDIFLMASEVTDRFGNWVRYTYDPASPLLLTRIEANDGRVITISNSGGLARSASDGTRTYTYGYGSTTLTSVVQPDGSRWTFDLAAMVPIIIPTIGEGANCDNPGDYPGDVLTGTITHPSGATGRFTTGFTLLGRTYVDRYCYYSPYSQSYTTGAVWPRYVSSQVLQAKEISGPGIATMQWAYTYQAPGGWSTCTTGSCLTETRTVTVTDPRGYQTRHLFGNRWRVNEGQLLQVDEGWNGTTALKTTRYRYRLPAGQAYPEQFGTQLFDRNDWLSARHRPQDQRVISQQGSTFTWQVDEGLVGFDELVRPRLVRKFSSLGPTRTETTQYHDHRTRWVMGQLASLTEPTTGVVELHEYDLVSALRIASHAFGKRLQSFAYNADGTLNSVSDAAGRATRLWQYKRGRPQLVSYPDGSTESQVINNLGRPDSRTNAAGTTTSFQYDAMGRMARVIHPNESNLAYHPTTQAFEQVGFPEVGLGAGHWRQTIATGNARTLRYFDALWRVRLEHRLDAANPAGTASLVETRYDADGRKTFASYPLRNLATVDGALAGTAWAYDALGRVFRQFQDSELGLLTTSTDYLSGLQKRVTNPRGPATTFSYQAFDSPVEDAIAAIAAPEGSLLAIMRDVLGKPLTITRSGVWGGQLLSATRSYVYDAYQRLCMTIEPETGATVQDYDTANNVAWRVSGLSAAPGTPCAAVSVPPSRTISYRYDTLNRLTSTSYGDGSLGIGRTYTADGLLASITSGTSSWGYAYNNRRLLAAETLTHNGSVYGFGWVIEPHGHVAGLNYPGGPNVAYAPDALGRPTMVSGFADTVWHHPNGQIGGYTLGNGIAHSTSQNVRGLPLQWRDAGVVQDLYAYDANGNVAGITDQQEGLATRAMGYDELDRLTSASGIWGAASFGYDTLDNLRSSTVGSRSVVAGIDAANRLVNVKLNGAPVSFGYDAGGNLTQRGTQGFAFDIGNRLQSATGRASYSYDGHGRRSYVAYADGQWKLQIYSQAGKLLGTRHSSLGDTRHIYLGERLIAEVTTLAGTSSTSFVHTDALGSPVARTNASRQITSRTRYEPYGATAAGTNPTGLGFTGHVNDADTGLVYMQQRYYDPLAGRFLSVDPVTTDAKTGRSFNRYAYAENNPYKFRDPDGRDVMFAIPLDGTAGGGVASDAFGGAGPQILAAADHLGAPTMASGAALFGGSSRYSRAAYGYRSGSSTAKAIRQEAEGAKCPKCGQEMVSGTKTSPQVQHEPSLSKKHYEGGGANMTPAEKKAYSNGEMSMSGANCGQCQRQEGAAQRQYVQGQERLRKLNE